MKELKVLVTKEVAQMLRLSEEYVRELIRRDQDRLKLRGLLLDGAQSRPTGIGDADYFASLRATIKKRIAVNQ